MFWGLTIEPGKRYMQTVAKSFHLSMACLELNNHDNEAVALMLDYEDQEYVLCNLHKQKVMQCQLDLNFQAGEKIAFYSAGKSRVHLTGFLVDDDDMELSDEEEEDEEVSDLSLLKQSPGKKRKDATPNALGNKKQKLETADDSDDDEDDDDDDDDLDDTFQDQKDEDDEEEEEDDDDEEEEEEEEEDDSDEKQTPEKLKPQQNKMKFENQKKKESPGQTPKAPTQNGQTPPSGKKNKNKNKQGGETPKSEGGNKSQKQVLAGGVVINDVKVGNGPLAKAGKQVTVYYVGKLKQNSKQFDATNSGPGFKFTLGRGEVIKGWDIGVAGMKVGGKRVITIPPQMAYGKKGQPPVIPPNSALVFEVELKNTN